MVLIYLSGIFIMGTTRCHNFSLSLINKNRQSCGSVRLNIKHSTI